MTSDSDKRLQSEKHSRKLICGEGIVAPRRFLSTCGREETVMAFGWLPGFASARVRGHALVPAQPLPRHAASIPHTFAPVRTSRVPGRAATPAPFHCQSAPQPRHAFTAGLS
jgi:hypothetical protein